MKWITALNLDQWAATIQARTVFPGLIADLIRASASEISGIRFPSGDKGQVRGFDGFLEAVGVPPFVPDGNSIWEFGVTEGAAGKAETDYAKRTKEVVAAVRANTTFVFVSPRTWDHPNKKITDWVKAKRDLGQWKGVEYFDGVQVETWLSAHPAVSSRYAKYEMKVMPQLGVYSIEEFWQEYSSRFAPALVEDILLAGREAQAKNLLQQLADRCNRLPFAADSPDEVIAFAVAAIRRADPAVRLYLEARALVVETEDTVRQLVNTKGLIFLPRRQARLQAGLLSQYGPTVVSAGADEQRGSHEVLARPSSTALGKALVSMGYSEAEGYDLARRCGRSLAVLARRIPSGTAERPEWIQHASALLPALLAGAWKNSETADKAIMCALGGQDDYEAVEAPLRPLTKLKDPPVDRVQDVWTMRASVDAFINLAHLIGEEHLRRFAETAKKVFSEITPTPKADEVFRPSANRDDAHSRWLREGMMTTLLHMAALHEQADFTVQGGTPQEYVNRIVRDLPGLSSDYRLMSSLKDNLALLAEAAPIPFLDALESLLEGDAAAIRPIFEEQNGLLMSHSSHPELLWALETLAWDPDVLLRTSLCLARLAAIDPGGSLSNRPINSLREIFLTWSPNTSANAQQRLGVLNLVVHVEPSIAWSLLEKLLPKHYDSSSSTQKPKFRESAGANAEVLTYGAIWEAQSAIIGLAIKHADDNAERWETLISAMNQFQPEPFGRTLEALDKFLGSQPVQSRFPVWDKLRKEVNRHRAFASTEWALNADVLARVDAVVTKYRPDDPLLQRSWLFDDWMPDLPEKVEQLDDPLAAVEPARVRALREILNELGIKGIVALAQTAKLPQLVAGSLSKLELSYDHMVELLLMAINAGDNLDPLSAAVVGEGIARFDGVWIDRLRVIATESNLDPERMARLLLATEENRKTWELVQSFGVAIEDAYWKVKHSFSINGPAEDLVFAAEKYLSQGRPMGAIESLHRQLSEVPSQVLFRLLDAAVSEINQSQGARGTMTSFYIERVFDELEGRDDVIAENLAKREFAYLPCFHNRKRPLTLHRLMLQNANTYMSVLSSVFKAANAEAQEVSVDARLHATAAYELLSSLHIVPGQHEEDVDQTLLSAWCNEVRRLSESMDRKVITDLHIGHLLAHAPASAVDRAWPHESVRSVIDQLASADIERGVITERFNMRGVYSKALDEGGQQERDLAKQAHDWADAMPGFPRTAAMLVRIAEGWLLEAKQADVAADKEALRW